MDGSWVRMLMGVYGGVCVGVYMRVGIGIGMHLWGVGVIVEVVGGINGHDMGICNGVYGDKITEDGRLSHWKGGYRTRGVTGRVRPYQESSPVAYGNPRDFAHHQLNINSNIFSRY